MSQRIYTRCSVIAVGCYLYTDSSLSTPVVAGIYSNGQVIYTVTGVNGLVSNVKPCSASSTTTTSTSTTTTTTIAPTTTTSSTSTTSTSSTTTTTTLTPLDFIISYSCDTISLVISGNTPTGGSGTGYQFGTSTFASQAAALANTSWVFATSIVYTVSKINGVYWVAMKDSLGNVIAKSVNAVCP